MSFFHALASEGRIGACSFVAALTRVLPHPVCAENSVRVLSLEPFAAFVGVGVQKCGPMRRAGG
jgi:hypothetical protein